MTRLLSLICILFFAVSALPAQIQKNAKSFGLDLISGPVGSVQTYELAGDYQWLLSDRLMLGLGARSALVTGLTLSQDERNGFSYTAFAGPTARYFLSPTSARLRWFAQGQFAVGLARVYDFNGNNKFVPVNRLGHYLEAGAGASWMIGDGLALEGQLGFRQQHFEAMPVQDAFFVNIGLRPYLNGFKAASTPPETYRKWLVNGRFEWMRRFQTSGPGGVTFDLEGLHFLSPNVALGGRVAYSDVGSRQLDISFQGRYYLNPRQRLQVFFQAETGALMEQALPGSQGSPSAFVYTHVQAGAGLNYFLTERLALELTLGRRWSSGWNKSGFTGGIGLKYLLGK